MTNRNVNGALFVDGPAGTFCPECIPTTMHEELGEPGVEVWETYSNGWAKGPICQVCHVAIPVYIDGRDERTEVARGHYLALFKSTSDAMVFETQALSVGDDFLPPFVKVAKDDSDLTSPAYWNWLMEQVHEMDAEAEWEALVNADPSVQARRREAGL